MNYSRNIASLQPSATLQLTARAAELTRQGRSIIALSAGQPDFPSPPAACEAAVRAMEQGRTGYTPTAGIPELREAVASATSRRRGIEFKPAEVVVSCGAKHSLANLLMAAINPGDRVLIPLPYWVSYPEMVRLAGGQPVYPGSGHSLITAADVEEAASSGVSGVILNSPGNPSGCVYTPGEARELADALAATRMWVISDDIYEDLVFTGQAAPHVLDFRPELRDRAVIVSGVSKTFAMTGWRIGWAVAPVDWAKLSIRVQEHTTSNPCSISQWASLAVVSGDAEGERRSMLASFASRRDLICSLLSGIPGMSFPKPEGAFYVFAGYPPSIGLSSAEFCGQLLDEEGLAVIPGSAFGVENRLRLSFAASDGDIRGGVERLASFLAKRGIR